MTELDEVLRHAQMAHFDNELSSFVVLMVLKNKEPELHMAVSNDDTYPMNGAVDMLKVEILKILAGRSEERKPRE